MNGCLEWRMGVGGCGTTAESGGCACWEWGSVREESFVSGSLTGFKL